MNRPAQAQRSSTAPRSQSGPSSSSQASGKRQFRVVNPIRREGQEKPFWLRVGTAWENEAKDGKPATFHIKIDALPMNGELVLFEDDGRDNET